MLIIPYFLSAIKEKNTLSVSQNSQINCAITLTQRTGKQISEKINIKIRNEMLLITDKSRTKIS